MRQNSYSFSHVSSTRYSRHDSESILHGQHDMVMMETVSRRTR